jgi:hypothetical protein
MVGEFPNKTVVKVWDAEREEIENIHSETAHIIQAATLSGSHGGRETLVFAVPPASFNLIAESLGAEAEDSNFITSFFGPRFDEQSGTYEEAKMRWSSNPLSAQGFTTFSYQIPPNSLFGTSIVVSELTFDLISDGQTITQTARLLDWFDILPPGRTQSVPPVYTVEVVAWFEEGHGQVEHRPLDLDDTTGGGPGVPNPSLDSIPEPKDMNIVD